ncbi:MAG: hypothetical protein KDK24_21260 [Pseudooceanicola sp.]|nr:hypothetical protein [Pseudooceanicola sp.]
MKRAIPLVSLLVLAACEPLSIYYRPGVTVAKLETDRTACEVSALRDVPVNKELRERPPILIPGETFCNAAGACVTRPDRWVSGGFYTIDTNRELRLRVTDQCMAKKGYQPVSIPRCEGAVAQSAPAGRTTVLPRLDTNSCAILNRDGTWQIVTTR